MSARQLKVVMTLLGYLKQVLGIAVVMITMSLGQIESVLLDALLILQMMLAAMQITNVFMAAHVMVQAFVIQANFIAMQVHGTTLMQAKHLAIPAREQGYGI